MALALAAGALAPSVAPAQDQAGFQSYLQTLRAKALAQGVSAATLDSVLPTLTLNQRVVDLDHRLTPGQVLDRPRHRQRG